jgi:hypothetical protein
MPMSITQAFVQQWDSTIKHLAQQSTSRLEKASTDKGSITGESFTYNQLGAIADTPENTVRHGDTDWSDAAHTTRVCLMKDFYQALPVDRADEPKMLANPGGTTYPEALKMAWNRRKDKVLFTALGATVTYKDGTTADLAAANKIAAGGTGFTKAKIIQGKKIFRAFEADGVDFGGDLYCCYNSEMMEDVLSDTTLTSADFMAVKLLYEGDISGKWMGISWIPYEAIDLVSSTYTTYMWSKSGLVRGTGFVEGNSQRRGDKKDTLQVSMAGSVGAIRVEENKVVQIKFV